MNYPLLIALSIVFTAHFGVNGMKRSHSFDKNEVVVTTNKPSISILPYDMVEKIFTYVSHNEPIYIPPIRYPTWSSEHGKDQRRIIDPKGIVGWFATMRSVCKDWHNSLAFSPATIKRILDIDDFNITYQLSSLNASENSKNYSHVQFLAQMMTKNRNTSNKYECEGLLYGIRRDNDSDKLKIFLENGLVHPGYQDLLNRLLLQDKINRLAMIVFDKDVMFYTILSVFIISHIIYGIINSSWDLPCVPVDPCPSYRQGLTVIYHQKDRNLVDEYCCGLDSWDKIDRLKKLVLDSSHPYRFVENLLGYCKCYYNEIPQFLPTEGDYFKGDFSGHWAIGHWAKEGFCTGNMPMHEEFFRKKYQGSTYYPIQYLLDYCWDHYKKRF